MPALRVQIPQVVETVKELSEPTGVQQPVAEESQQRGKRRRKRKVKAAGPVKAEPHDGLDSDSAYDEANINGAAVGATRALHDAGNTATVKWYGNSTKTKVYM